MFLVSFICGISVVYLLCNAISFEAVSFEKINKIRESEIVEGNYEIENWSVYEKNGKRLFFCDGSLYEYSPKYMIFRLSNGLLFGNAFDTTALNNKNEYDSLGFPYMKYGNLLWMTKNLSVHPKEKDLVMFDAVTGLKVVPRSICLYEKESNCDKYGRFYDYSMALSVCPDGWRLPKDEEWRTLKGKIDSLKFADVFAGSCQKNDSGIYECEDNGTVAVWWSSSVANTVGDLSMCLEEHNLIYVAAEKENDIALHTVRCVKDASAQ